MNVFAGFAPWIVYWILIGSVSFRTAVLIAFLLSLIVTVQSLVRGGRPKLLEVGGTIAFAILVIVTFATNDHFLEQWIQPLTNASLFVIALASVLMGKPFTLQYALESVTPEEAATPGFKYINTIITWVWVVAFAIMTVASIVPPAVEGDATIHEGGDTLSIVGYWVIPFTALGLAAIFSAKFPDWFVAKLSEPATGGPGPYGDPVELAPAPAPQAGPLALTATPSRSLADAPFSLTVTGAAPGTPVQLTAQTLDAFGRLWAATAQRVVAADGTIERPEALIEAMVPADDGPLDVYAPPREAMAVTLSARVGEETVGATLARRLLAKEVTRTQNGGERWGGVLFMPPAGQAPAPGVLVVPGTGGVDSVASTASLLASHGFAALAIELADDPAHPEAIEKLPLERIGDAAAWLAARAEVGRVGVLAQSRGAEGALAAAALIDGFDPGALVLVSPSAYAWQALGDEGAVPDTPAWTLAGLPLPFAPMDPDATMHELLRNALMEGRDRHRHRPTLLHLASSFPADRAPAQAALPAERVDAPLMLVVGEADELWPSAAMAQAIRARRGERPGDVLLSYRDCGHFLRHPVLPTTASWTSGIAFGGTPEGLAAAQADSFPRILEFLRAQLS
jgi:dienelactone hydrolase